MEYNRVDHRTYFCVLKNIRFTSLNLFNWQHWEIHSDLSKFCMDDLSSLTFHTNVKLPKKLGHKPHVILGFPT